MAKTSIPSAPPELEELLELDELLELEEELLELEEELLELEEELLELDELLELEELLTTSSPPQALSKQLVTRRADRVWGKELWAGIRFTDIRIYF